MNDYNKWLKQLKGMLLSTGHFEKGVTLNRKSWKHFFDCGYTPYEAIQIDFGYNSNTTSLKESIPISQYWESFL